MKKSDLTSFIKEEILSSLSENTEAEIEKTKELTAAIKDLEKAKEEAGIEEAEEIKLPASAITSFAANIKNPQTFASNILAVVDKLAEKENDTILKHPKLKRALDMLRDLSDDKQEITVNEDATPKGEDYFYDYLDIGMSYLEGFGKKHSLDDTQLEKLGKKIVDQLYKGDVGKAYDAIVKRGVMKEDEDKEPSDAEIKKNKSLAKAAEELAVLTREMKSLAKKYSKAKGQEKEDLLNKLKSKTKLKKELDKILDK